MRRILTPACHFRGGDSKPPGPHWKKDIPATYMPHTHGTTPADNVYGWHILLESVLPAALPDYMPKMANTLPHPTGVLSVQLEHPKRLLLLLDREAELLLPLLEIRRLLPRSCRRGRLLVLFPARGVLG